MKYLYYEREAQVIYLLMTDRQPMIYWAINHLLARLYFDSNGQETSKRQAYMFSVFRHYMK